MPNTNDQKICKCLLMNKFRSTQIISTVSGSPFKRSISIPGGSEQDLNFDSGGVSIPIPRTDDETFNAFFLTAIEIPPSNLRCF